MLQGMRASAKYIWILIAGLMLVWLVFSMSGLDSRTGTTLGSSVGSVNGVAITFATYSNQLRQAQLEQQRQGVSLNADQERQLSQQVFDRLVTDELLRQDYEKRGIVVTDDEIRDAAMQQPYPPVARAPEFQTEGRFDYQKYQRFMQSPTARQQGILADAEAYYRDALYKSKLFEAIATSVYATDGQLWRLWRDTRDSARVSYVAVSVTTIPDSLVKVSDADVKAYFEAHQKELTDLPGSAVITAARLPRLVTAADTARAKAKAEALRTEIQKGAKFEDVARRESSDSTSAANGGALGTVRRGTYVPAFETAVFSLPIGVVSAPVLTPYGFHIIRVDARTTDSVTTHHILVRIAQSDSEATATDRQADQLAKVSGASNPASFDSVVKAMGLETARVTVTEGSPATWNGRYLPGASAWAFEGAKIGEIGELLDAQDAYYLVRLDSLTPGGKPTLDKLKDQVRAILAREKKLDLLLPQGQALAAAAASAPSFEAAMKAKGLAVQTTPFFTRGSSVAGLDQGSEAIGAAFGQPVGKVGGPVKARTAVVVERVDARVPADSAAWTKQAAVQRDQVQQTIREQMVRQYLQNLRMNAKIVDNRKEIQAASRVAGS
ncbi:MAG TPA: SurA N-terminal domain-containing protein [Gemmatimonadaceae bacterium]|nr:SurA N-terminal domain-containing protein [Gemmatimonadaceae bacterium]